MRSWLKDAKYRVKSAFAQLILPREWVKPIMLKHILDGYVLQDQTPSAGYITWSNCKIIFGGVTYNLANGNTDSKYCWWDLDAPTVLQETDSESKKTFRTGL